MSGGFPENGVNYWGLYAKDHEIARRLGLNAYRIGLEWSRIFPKNTAAVEVDGEKASDGNISSVNLDDKALEALEKLADKKALDHRLIVEDLRMKGFKVFVCLNHFTLPLWIHDPITTRATRLKHEPKGWLDETTVVEFAKYAAYVVYRLGDIVDYWATFNEPMAVCEAGYMLPESGFPPGVGSFKAVKKVAKHLAVAHARAYDAIKKFDTVRADDDSPASAWVSLIHNVIPAQPFRAGEKIDADAVYG